ncbi:endonuclease/exonuclease/phosphatase family protein [candidate division KSB1 bacterium]
MSMKIGIWFIFSCLIFSATGDTQIQSSAGMVTRFEFEGNVKSLTGTPVEGVISGNVSFVKGLDGQALSFQQDNGFNNVSIGALPLNGTDDFSIQCWVKTSSNDPTVFISKKDFTNKGITTQKNAGWALYSSGGTFAWTIGSGDRRINYERDNGEKMPVNDGQWHQLTMTYSKELSEFRLYYDGKNTAIYNVGFDFANSEPLNIGSSENDFDYDNKILPEIENGAKQLQAMVDEFNKLDVDDMEGEDLVSLIVDSRRLLRDKLEKLGLNEEAMKKKQESISLEKVNELSSQLASSPYTIFQNRNLTLLKPVSKIYSLKGKKVVINNRIAKSYTKSEELNPSDFTMDELSIWEKTLSVEEVWNGYLQYQNAESAKLEKNIKTLTVGVWNIWHGGQHWSLEEDGWDSRKRIAEMIRKENIDVILMQETYSSGDFIAAELGYYYAASSDWDYRMQGENISVISRYPIKEVHVTEATEFNNVGCKLVISETQEIYAMSNWYGMPQFTDVFDFHKGRFEESDNIPILFGGDFNAVPHTDGGNSPASEKMLESGFMDAFRSLYPDVQKYPGYSHRGGRRIDQLYYKGIGLKNIATKVVSSWSSGFPSDHFLIISKFDLNYSTVDRK